MHRGAWRAIVHEVTESATTEVAWHAHTAYRWPRGIPRRGRTSTSLPSQIRPPDPPLLRVVKELSTTEECKVVKKLLPPKAPGPGGRISVPPQSNRAKAQKQE